MRDSLDKEKYQYNLSGYHLNHRGKIQMQSMYRQDLDEIIRKKNKEKQQTREKEEFQKKRYNQIVAYNQETEKVKQNAYKNYYNVLMNNQEHHQNKYVSPFSYRDSLKDQHISYSIEEGARKNNERAMEEQKRIEERKSSYQNELRNQIEERKKISSRDRQVQMKEKQDYQRRTKSPSQLKQQQRLRHLEEMNKYREDLNRVKSQQEYYKTRSRVDGQDFVSSSDHHHPLVNPVPYNVQNPYIRKEMEKRSYFARVANQNMSNS